MNTLLKNLSEMFLEINLRSRKWLLSCFHNQNTHLIADYLHFIGRGFDLYSSKYVLGDL